MRTRSAGNNLSLPLASSWRMMIAFLELVLMSAVRRMEPCGGGAFFVRAEEDEGSTNGVFAAASPPSSAKPAPMSLFSSSSLSLSSSIITSVVGVAANASPSTNDPVTGGTSARGRRRAQSTSSISGFSFFDSDSDGIHDLSAGSLDFGLGGVVLNLFSCTDDERITTTVTDALGYYTIEAVSGGQYYITVTPPQYYDFIFSHIWNDKIDETSALLHPEADSDVNPDTGRTKCFALGEGGDATVSFGLELDIPSIDGIPTTTPPPSPAPSTAVIVSSVPSTSPASTTTLPPTKSPSKSPEMAPPPTEVPSDDTAPAPSIDAGATSVSTKSPASGLISVGVTETSPTATGMSESPSKSPATLPPAPLESTSEPSNPPISASVSSEELYGPVTTKGLVMTIHGIDQLEDEEAWSAATADYIMTYFNDLTNDYPGEFDVTASIQVTSQTSSNDALFQRRRVMSHRPEHQLTGWQLERQEGGRREPGGRKNNVRRREPERRLQEGDRDSKYVQVTYDQTSSYRTVDVERYDHVYIATEPFSAGQGMEWYVGTLRTISPHYEGVSSADMTYSASPNVGSSPAAANDGGYIGLIYTLVGVAVLGCVASVLFVLRRRKKRREETLRGGRRSLDEMPTGGVQPIEIDTADYNASERSDVSSVTLPRVQPTSESSGSSGGGPNRDHPNPYARRPSRRMSGSSLGGIPEEDSLKVGDDNRGGRSPSNSVDKDVAPMANNSKEKARDGQGIMLTWTKVVTKDVVAPPGKLYVSIETPPNGGAAFVCDVTDASPLLGSFQLEDKIIAVDGESVEGLSAVSVSKLLAKKSLQAERKITISREVKPEVATIDVIAPAGMLLVTIESTPEGGASVVAQVKDASPLRGKVRSGDLVVAVDDEDVRETAATGVATLLAKNSQQTERRITVLRFNPKDGTEKLDFAAPKGRLGVFVQTDLVNGEACVCEVEQSSPMIGKIQEGDRIVAVDDEEVKRKLAGNVTMSSRSLVGGKIPLSSFNERMFLGRESGKTDWKITVFRDGATNKNEGKDKDEKYSSKEQRTDYSDLTISNLTCDLGASEYLPFADEPSFRFVETEKPTAIGADDTIDVVAPSGKLGITFVADESSTLADPVRVLALKEDSALVGKLRPGDEIVAVDDEDVSGMSSVEVAKLLAHKAWFEKRKITVSRREICDNGDAAAGNPSPIDDGRLFSGLVDSSEFLGDEGQQALDVVAPSGMLGIVLTTPDKSAEDSDGCVYVLSVKGDSPLFEKILPGDKIVAVDGEDVRKMNAIQVTQLLANKASSTRKFTVVREDNASEHGGDATLIDILDDPSRQTEARVLNVVAPSGRMGIVLTSPETTAQDSSRLVYILSMHEDSPMEGKLHLGDKIIAVDGEDVQEMTAIDVTKLLSAKSSNTRRITVIRDELI